MKNIYFIFLIVVCAFTPGMAAGCAIKGSIDNHSQVNESCDESLAVHGNVGGGSTVTLTSRNASAGIDGASTVTITSNASIKIGEKIGGGSQVDLTSQNASISIGGGIDGESTATFTSNASINIGGKIGGGVM